MIAIKIRHLGRHDEYVVGASWSEPEEPDRKKCGLFDHFKIRSTAPKISTTLKQLYSWRIEWQRLAGRIINVHFRLEKTLRRREKPPADWQQVDNVQEKKLLVMNWLSSPKLVSLVIVWLVQRSVKSWNQQTKRTPKLYSHTSTLQCSPRNH